MPDKRVKIQGVIQKYIDHSISSTINLPEDVEPEVISDIYFMAWQKKLKGVTIYRDGSRFPILSVENKLTPFQAYKDKKFEIVNDDGETVEVRGDHVIKMSMEDLQLYIIICIIYLQHQQIHLNLSQKRRLIMYKLPQGAQIREV